MLNGKTRRALDSTLLDDAVATQDTVTQLVAAIRRVRRLVPAAAALQLGAHDYDQQPGKPACAWDDQAAREQLVSGLSPTRWRCWAPWRMPSWTPPRLRRSGCWGGRRPRRRPGQREATFRIARKVAPDRVISVVDPDSRHMHKSRRSYRDGYKAHLAAEPETGLSPRPG